MRGANTVIFCAVSFLLSSCSYYSAQQSMPSSQRQAQAEESPAPVNYADRMPQTIAASGQKVIVVDPRVHAWGAYDSEGSLVRGGIATAGSSYCPDIGRPCRTHVGTFRIYSLGNFSCKSHIFPVGRGGAPMPYCMFFSGGQGLHGSYEVVDGNISHGCVRLTVDDAEWMRFNFANIGTKVIVRPY